MSEVQPDGLPGLGPVVVDLLRLGLVGPLKRVVLRDGLECRETCLIPRRP